MKINLSCLYQNIQNTSKFLETNSKENGEHLLKRPKMASMSELILFLKKKF